MTTSTINPVQNEIICEVQSFLMSNAPVWETREEYVTYVQYEESVGEVIRNLNSLLTIAVSDGADKNTLKRIAINFIS